MATPASDADHAGDGHYFAPEPTVGSAPRRVRLALPDLTVTLTTDRGVFSAGGVDAGTKLLLLEGPRPAADEAGALLDLGCGYGPIAVTLARRAPGATVWAVDVNARARSLCEQNAAACGVADRIRVAAPDEVPARQRFAGLWSNPPIRVGKPALHDLLRRWLARVEPGGVASLVVKRHLGADSLARWLQAQGCATTRRASRAGYRLLDVACGDAADHGNDADGDDDAGDGGATR